MTTTPHASLVALLKCLDRDEITALELVTGQVVTAQRAQGALPLTRVPLTEAQLTALMQHTPIFDALARNTGTPEVLQLALGERSVKVAVHKDGTLSRVAIARGVAEAVAMPVAPAPEPTQPPAHAVSLAPPPPPSPAPPPQPRPVGLTGAAAAPDAIDLGPPPERPVATVPAASQPPRAEHQPAPPRPALVLAEPPSAPSGLVQAVTPAPAHVLATPAQTHAPAAFTSAQAPAAPRPMHPPQSTVVPAALTALVQAARARHASDVHVVSGQQPRYRVAGELSIDAAAPPIDTAAPAQWAAALLDTRQTQQLENLGYADAGWDLGPAGRVRANLCRHPAGLKVCLRLIPLRIPTLEELGLPEDLAAVSHFHQGLAVISGPSGHGKSTTLAALVERINTETTHHIIVVEDPIETVFGVRQALISQREVGAHTASYARALKAALREDPDVIVVGELRDRETVEIALSAAETGHLVLSTMNTRSAAKTIDRLIDLFPPDDQAQVRATLAGALKMVISQRLVPTVDGKQAPAVELLTGNVPLWALIRDNKLFQLPSLQQRGRSAGMIRLDTSLMALVQAGRVRPEIARAMAESPAEWDRLMAPAPRPPQP